LMSAAMLALVVSYLLTRPKVSMPPLSEADMQAVARVLDWRLLAAACVPLAVLTYEGKGYNDGTALGASTGVGTSLASSLFTILVPVAAAAILLRVGPRWFLPVLAAQSLLLAAAGERSPVLIDAVVLAIMLACAGLRPPVSQLGAAVALTLIAILALTAARAEQGRSLYHEDSGFGVRAAALGGGVVNLAGSSAAQGGPGLVAQAALRLDGTAFAGAILQAQSLGYPRLSTTYIPESLLIAVPSAVWQSKLDHGDGLNPAVLETDDFGLQQVNYLPTLPGLYAGFLSPVWLAVFFAALGAACGWGEKLLFRRCTPARLVMLAGAVTAALEYEKGLPGMLVAVRDAAVTVLAVKIIEMVQSRRAHRQDWPKPAITSSSHV
jgi:hypothetical protein